MIATGISVLEAAVARNSGIVLSLPSAGMLRHLKSRFLGDAPEGIWLESAPAEAALVDSLIENARPVGISFKNGDNKAVFSSLPLRRDTAYRINADTTVEAVLIRNPEDVKVVQRRNTYRVRVPEEYDLSARIWRIGKEVDLRDRPLAATEVQTQLIDISIGGMGVTLRGNDGQPPVISTEDRLRIELTVQGEPIVIEGRLRYHSKPLKGDTCRAGVQFQALQDDIEGRRITALLTRMLGELQRLELRRHRLGML